MFGRKKKTEPKVEYDPKRQRAVIHCSICTGEQVAGFKDLETGKFTEVMLIRSPGDLENFKAMYHLTDVAKEY